MDSQRVRTRSEPDVSEILDVNFILPSPSHQTRGPFVISRRSESIADVRTPKYQSRKKAGEIINNPCSYVSSRLRSDGSGFGSYSHNNGNFSYTLSGPLTYYRLTDIPDAGYPPTSVNKTELRFQATLSCLANVDKPPLEVGEDVLELRQNFQFLTAPLKGISRGLDGLHSVYRSRRSNFASQDFYSWLESNWLRYRFGFTPMVQSLHGILKQVQSPTKNPPEIRRAHGRATDTFSGQKSFTSNACTFQTSLYHNVSYHAAIVYKVQNATFDFRWRYGLRNKDLPKAFWNKYPLSFMVDRIYDVSSCMSAVGNLLDPSVTVLGGSITCRERSDQSVQLIGESNPDYSSSVSGEKRIEENFSYTREVWKPTPADLVPVFKPQNLFSDVQRTADLVTLITSRLRR